MEIDEIVEHYLKYIREEYKDDFVNDDEGEPYIRFDVREFEDFCSYILKKALQKFKEQSKQEVKNV